MGRDRPGLPPIVFEVEGLLTDEERGGGHSARSLAALIVRRVHVDLRDQGVRIPCKVGADFTDIDA